MKDKAVTAARKGGEQPANAMRIKTKSRVKDCEPPASGARVLQEGALVRAACSYVENTRPYLIKINSTWPKPERHAGEHKQGQWFLFFTYQPKAEVISKKTKKGTAVRSTAAKQREETARWSPVFLSLI